MPLTGFEPATYSLGGNRSNPAELQGLKTNAGKRIRTSELTKRQDLESCAFDHFAIPAYINKKKYSYKKFYKSNNSRNIEDSHSNRVTPNPIPNLEVKAVTSFMLVSHKTRSIDAVSLIFTIFINSFSITNDEKTSKNRGKKTNPRLLFRN